MEETFDNWTVQLRKGLLELCVLSAVGAGERYGYELVRALVEARGLEISEGSIYPLLSRMRKQGWVATRLEESPDGPARKYYRLTATGRARLAAMADYYESLTKAVASLRRHPDKPGTPRPPGPTRPASSSTNGSAGRRPAGTPMAPTPTKCRPTSGATSTNASPATPARRPHRRRMPPPHKPPRPADARGLRVPPAGRGIGSR